MNESPNESRRMAQADRRLLRGWEARFELDPGLSHLPAQVIERAVIVDDGGRQRQLRFGGRLSGDAGARFLVAEAAGLDETLALRLLGTGNDPHAGAHLRIA